LSTTISKELLTLLLLILAGVLLLPIAIFLVGSAVFGPYAGSGFGEFYRDIHADLMDGQAVVIFLLVAPYLVWQLLRFTFRAFRHGAPRPRR
jgi:hypothetical protein